MKILAAGAVVAIVAWFGADKWRERQDALRDAELRVIFAAVQGEFDRLEIETVERFQLPDYPMVRGQVSSSSPKGQWGCSREWMVGGYDRPGGLWMALIEAEGTLNDEVRIRRDPRRPSVAYFSGEFEKFARHTLGAERVTQLDRNDVPLTLMHRIGDDVQRVADALEDGAGNADLGVNDTLSSGGNDAWTGRIDVGRRERGGGFEDVDGIATLFVRVTADGLRTRIELVAAPDAPLTRQIVDGLRARLIADLPDLSIDAQVVAHEDAAPFPADPRPTHGWQHRGY